MRVLVSLEHRFSRTPDGAVWTPTVNSYTFWTRYLDIFDEVRVLARIREVERPDPQWIRADGPNVAFHAIPYFVGPGQYLQSYFSVRRTIAAGLANPQAVIMRVPSTLSMEMTRSLKRRRQPFGLEVVADPYDVFAPGSMRHPLRPLFRRLFSSTLMRQCREAKAVAYVTAQALQKRYPSQALMVGISDVSLPETAFVTSYSSIELDSTQILSTSSRTPVKGVATLVFVGSLEQLYKAPDVLLRALGLATARGCDLRLRIVGDGRYREELQVMALKLGIAERCQFLGQLPGGVAVQNVLDGSDIFVLPSRVEGLPRAMIEAMARGLPCIGSTVGGIPELLEPESLVKPGDPDQLASAIETLVADPERQKRMAMRNLREAAKYVDHQLRKKRIEFYRHVKLCSSEWLGQNHTKPILSGSGRTGASTLH